MSEESLRWIEPPPVEVPQAIYDMVGGPPFLAQALFRRGLTELRQVRAFLNPGDYLPASPSELPDLAKAADLLEAAVHRNQVIGVWGDFDVDGQTATTLLVQALKKIGAKVQSHIPVRARESHGVSVASLQRFLAGGIQLVLTCDTGISAHDAANWALAHRLEFIVTDHHILPESLPQASAVVNPQRLASNHPLYPMCGVGVSYQLAEELLQRAGRSQEAADLLDLVALGTIADLAYLRADNRYLVQRGLERMRSTPRAALQAMFELAEIDYAQLSEETVAFILAPRLNALGRLDDANPVVPFFLADSISEARPLAARLEALNAHRKMLCDQVFQAAQAQIRRDRSLLAHPVLFLSHPTWPAGILGIVASRLVDLFRRPVVLAVSPPGELARASARSIEGIDITQALRLSANLLANYGGHRMAAGFSLDAERLPEIQRALDQAVSEQANQPVGIAELAIDATIPLDQVTFQMVESLDRLAPFGPGNPPLIFASQNLSLQNQTVFGKSGEHLRLIVEDAKGRTQKVTWWQGAGAPLPEGRFDLAFSVRSSTYLGQRSLEMEWIAFRSIPETIPLRTRRPIVTIIDERDKLDPERDLEQYLLQPDMLVFAEGDHNLRRQTSTRLQIQPTDTLIIWTIPPGRSELSALLDRTAPSKVIWFGVPCAVDRPGPFLARLSGLVRFALKNRLGKVKVIELAAACAQRERTVKLGIDWLAARGHITIHNLEEDELHITGSGSPDAAAAARCERDLEIILKETEAFRGYCQQTNLTRLFNLDTPQD